MNFIWSKHALLCAKSLRLTDAFDQNCLFWIKNNPNIDSQGKDCYININIAAVKFLLVTRRRYGR